MVNNYAAVLALRVEAPLISKGLALTRHVEAENQPFTTSQRSVGDFYPSPARYWLLRFALVAVYISSSMLRLPTIARKLGLAH
jgi:hypothetical protein